MYGVLHERSSSNSLPRVSANDLSSVLSDMSYTIHNMVEKEKEGAVPSFCGTLASFGCAAALRFQNAVRDRISTASREVADHTYTLPFSSHTRYQIARK